MCKVLCSNKYIRIADAERKTSSKFHDFIDFPEPWLFHAVRNQMLH